MDLPDPAEKPWDHPWTTEEMREKRADWNLAGDSGLLQHLHQFSNKLMTTANKTQEALNSLSSELDETIIFIDNITNTSLALANTQFIESRVCDDDVEAEPREEQQLEVPKTKEQIEAELIASIGESMRRGIAIMDEKYETLEVEASDSEDEEEIPIRSVILRAKDPYQDRLLPYVIGSEKWEKSDKIGLESSSSESEHQEEDDFENDSESSAIPVFRQNSIHNPGIDRSSSSLSDSNDHNVDSDVKKYAEDRRSEKSHDIFDSENENIRAESSLPNNSMNTAPNFAEELSKRLGNVLPTTEKSINTQTISEPLENQPKDDLFTPEDEDLFGAPSKNLFDEQPSLFNDLSPNTLWRDKPAKSFKSSVIPPSFDGPPPINDAPAKSKSAIDDLFGDADSEDSDDIFSGKSSIGKPLKKKNSSTINPPVEDKKRINKLLSVGGGAAKDGMATSTPETNDVANSLFGNDSEDIDDLFIGSKKRNDWTEAKATVPDKSAGSTPAEASDISQRKKPVGGVSILGDIDIFSSRKLLRQISSDSSSSKSSLDFETTQSRLPSLRDDTAPQMNDNSASRSSVMAGAATTESQESSGVFLQPPSIDDVTTGSNASSNFQPQMTSTLNSRTGDIYRDRIVSDSLFAAKTLGDRENDSGSLNNAQMIEEASSEVNDNPEPFEEEPEDIFGPPPLPKKGSKTGSKSKVSSLFDDSDSGDDLFSRTSSGSRSQRSVDFLSTTATSVLHTSDKSKILRTKGLFDDDDDDDEEEEEEKEDAVGAPGAKDEKLATSFDVDSLNKKNVIRESSTSESKNISSVASRDNNDKKESTVKVSQSVTSASTKLESIFDDLDDDEEDLFAPSFSKKSSKFDRKNTAPSLFDDSSDDLFAIPGKKPVIRAVQKSESESTSSKTTATATAQVSAETATKSGPKIGDKIRSKVIEQLAAKLEVSKTEEKVKRDDEGSVTDEAEILVNSGPKDLAAKILDGLKAAQKSKGEELAAAVAKPGIARKPEALKKLESVNKAHQIRRESASLIAEARSSSISEAEESTSRSFEERTESLVVRSEETASRSDESSNAGKREPPNSLEIRSSSTSSEKSSAVQRRVVSGKIKNLMGRMNDLKILSPTDSPPVWRKNEERTDEGGDKDVEDGGSFSSAAKESPPASPEEPTAKLVASPPPPPPAPEEKDLEPAISFDEPVQVQTLSVAASKSRVRIQTKRRPQSRRARQIALRKSGIDFDTMDGTDSPNEPNSAGAETATNSITTERLIVSTAGSESLNIKITESSSSTLLEDRSEISFSKESTVSVNKNTLLSPSTDEEDLFDVPPDLPEDPPREDALFGRAPILSPVESFVDASSNDARRIEKRTSDGKEEMIASSARSTRMSAKTVTVSEEPEDGGKRPAVEEAEKKVADPLRDGSHDPLKDPSTLFPFVTKTPSPEKGKNLLFNDDDDSLFSSKINEGKSLPAQGEKKQSLDLFADDPETDFFAASLPKTTRKTNRGADIDLFNDDDEQLFAGGPGKKSLGGGRGVTASSEAKESLFADSEKRNKTVPSSSGLFSDDENSDIFTAATTKPTESPATANSLAIKNVDNIFGDQFSDEEDMFATRKSAVIKKQTVSSTGLFDDDAGDLFASSKSSFLSKSESTEARKVVRKTATRDLRKTAEKIVEDPLSMLQED